MSDAEVSFNADPGQAFAALRGDAIDLFMHLAPTSWQLANGPENDDLISLYAPLTEEALELNQGALSPAGAPRPVRSTGYSCIISACG